MTAAEFLAKRYNEIACMSNISQDEVNKLRAEALKEAKKLEKKQLVQAFESLTLRSLV